MTFFGTGKSNAASENTAELARGAGATLADRLLRLADGIIFTVPLAVALAGLLLLFQWQESWLAGLCALTVALAAGILAGSFLGWRLGHFFVGGTWWHRRQRDAFLTLTGLSLIFGMSVIAYHQIRIPGVRRMETRVTKLLEFAAARATSASNPDERAKFAAVQVLAPRYKEIYDNAAKQKNDAASAGDAQLQKTAAKVEETAKKSLQMLESAAKDPTKPLPTTDGLEQLPPFINILAEISVTNRHTYNEIHQSPPLLLRLFGLMGGLFGLGWMDGGKETLTELVERTTRGTPPSADDIRELLTKLKSTEQVDQEAFLNNLTAAIQRIQSENPGRVAEGDMKRFLQDVEKIREAIRSGEGDRTVNEAIASLQQVLPAPATTADQFGRARQAVLDKLEIDPDSSGPRFTTEGQKELLRRLLEKKRPNDWQKLWDHPQYGLRQIEVRKR